MTLLVPTCHICKLKIGLNQATPDPYGHGWVHKTCVKEKK